MRLFRYLIICCLVVVTGYGMSVSSVHAEEEEESFAEVLNEAGLDPSLKEVVTELFEHVQALENSFRNLRWNEAAQAVDNVDLFYNKVLAVAERKDINIDLNYLQAFEFSLAEISRGIQRHDRVLVEKRFLQLQPELFDILDKVTTTPLRLTASRFYADLAIRGVQSRRYDIARDELGEITEFMEQVEPLLQSRGYDIENFNRQLAIARKKVHEKAPDCMQALDRLRMTLEYFHQSYATLARCKKKK